MKNQRNDITKIGCIGGYIGGISGVSFDKTITNCYVVCELGNAVSYPGIVTGTGGVADTVSNCYYKTTQTSLPVTSGECYMVNNSSFYGNGYIWTLNTPSYVNNVFRTDLVDALNAWVDENNTDGRYFHWRADTANINGGFPVFEIPPCLYVPRTFSGQPIIACDSYTFNNITYTESVSINDTLQAANGCDSISSQIILINHPVQYYDYVQVCEGQTYTFNGRTLTETGSYYDTIFNGAANGCDSIVYLWLEVQNPTSWSNARVCEGQSYSFNGTTLTETGSYYDTIPGGAANGCDSIVYLWLEVRDNYSYPSVEICQGDYYSFAGQPLTESGTYFDTLTNVSANGCDSIIQLNFTVHPTYHLFDTVYVPEGSLPYLYTYRDWTQEVGDYSIIMSGNTTVVDTRTNPSGTIFDNGGPNSNYTDYFDGTIILTADEGETIKLNGNYHLEGCCDYISVYDGYGVSGNTLLYTCGTGNVDVQSNTGYLTIRFTSDGSVNYDGFELQWNTRRAIDTLLTAAGDYTFAAHTSYGCDNTFNLHLEPRAAYSRTDSITVCSNNLPFTYADTLIANAGTYTFFYLDRCGIDSTVTLHLTVNNPVHTATTETVCEAYTWNETSYTTSGTYTYSHPDANGCTQVDTLHLTVNNPIHTATTQASCETYTWNGTTYTTSGDYTYSHTDANGCTQVDTLHLTINTPVTTEVYDTACDSYSWQGTDYTASGDYQRTWTSALPGGCDSTVTLHLSINHSVETTVADTAEGSYTWNGATYSESGTYTWTGTTVEGCDSTVTLQLIITQVGIEMVEENGVKVNVYPNPTSGLLTIDATDILSVEVIDQAGRKVDTYKNTNRIDLGGLPAGSYLLKIHLLRGQSIQRVILK